MKDLSRRTFLFLTGGTGAALAAEPGRQLVNKLIPLVNPPQEVRPGEWSFYTTTCRECPAGCGMHLWHRDGRVTKAEGNPQHPVNRGTLCARGQSALQGLYDPDRLRGVRRRAGGLLLPASWEEAIRELTPRLRAGRVALISDLQTGALAEVMQAFAAAFGADRLLFHETFNYEPLRAAHQTLFARADIPEYRLDRCEYILSFAADFLETWISPVEYASQFAAMHRYANGHMGKFAYVGPRLSMTAANADEFLAVPPAQIPWVALAVLQAILSGKAARGPVASLRQLAGQLQAEEAAARCGLPPEQIGRLAQEFVSAAGSVALAGPTAGGGPAAYRTALAATLLNVAAGRLGETVDFGRVHALGNAATAEALRRFVDRLGPDDILFVHQANLAFTRPELAETLRRAGTVVYLTQLADETAQIADWLLPVDNPLEAWGDYEPYTGVHGLQQPTMARLHDSRGAGDILLALADAAGRPLSPGDGGQLPPDDFTEWLRRRWQELHRRSGSGGDFATFWRQTLQSGGIWLPAAAGNTALRPGIDLRLPPATAPPEAARTELWLWPSLYFFDGRLANRAWLQEMPHPVSTVVWGNWLDLHPERAKALGIKEGDLLQIATATASITAPVRVTDEVTPGTAAILLGQGHSARSLSVAGGVGENPFLLLGDSASFFPEIALQPAGKRRPPVYLSASREQQERHLLQAVTVGGLRQGNVPAETILPTPAGYRTERDLYPPHRHKNHRWAMAIDLHRCIGCHACSVACYAENNIPVVGRTKVAKGREMAWLRVPPYRLAEAPQRLAWLPLPCQHCDAAPCEPVCPVYAAHHNEDGLNAQLYNRCIGTRYCSNNCPYKVRRFNWFNIEWKPPLELQLNPEVTVRSRGVMEKCTFCVQRIRQAEQRARVENRKIRDGEVVPACVQTCPARVYTFGDLHDENSEIYRIFTTHPRRYQVLQELNTKPAVVYLKKVILDV